MGGGNSGFSRVSGKGGSTREKLNDWQKSFPFVQNKTAATEVALVSGAAFVTNRGLKRRSARKAAMAPEGATRAPKTTGVDIVFNSWTKGPKRVLATPRVSSKVPAVYEPDSPIQQVRASVTRVTDRERRTISRVGGDVLRAPATFLYGAETAMGPPNPKTFPNARANVSKAVSAPFKSDYKPQVRTFDPMVGKAPAPAKPALTQTGYSMKKSLAARHAKPAGTPASKAASVPTPAAQPSTKRYGGGPPAREMTPAQKGQLRKKTNKAAAAAKPIMQQGLRSRFAVPTPKETPAPKAAATPKAPAATTVEIKAPEMTARAFQPGKLEGETRAQTSARHVAEHAADNAAKRAEKKKVEPKNKTKAPTSAKPPSPAAVEKAPVRHPRSEPGFTFNPSEGSWSNDLQTRAYTLTNRANDRAATADAATRAEKKIAKTSYNKYKHAASRTFKSSQRKRFPTVPPPDMPMSPSEPHSPAWGAQGFEPERVSAPKVKSQPSDRTFHRRGIMLADKADMKFFTGMAAPAKEKKAAKKEYNKYKHAASRTFNTSQRKRFGTGPGGTPATPSKPAGPKAPSGGFVSTFKPQVRTFDPMVGQKQYGLNSKPFDDSPEKHRELVKEGMKGRTGDDQRPKHSRNAAGVFVLDSGPYSDVGRREATTRMFPGTPDNPRSGQPHMTGKGAKVVGSDRNFRLWQGPNRSETVVEHRSGRQLNLPFDPKKNKNPVDNKAILDFANKNEKPFLQTTGWDGARAITQKGGRLGQIGRFSLGAAKAGGILALPITAISVLSGGADPLQAAGFQVDRAGEGNQWRAKSDPKGYAAYRKSMAKGQADRASRRAGSQFKGASSWSDIARKYTAGKK